MQNHDSNLEWEMALAAAESDGEDEINKQIAEQQKKEAMINSYQEMNKKSRSVKEEKKIPESSNKKKPTQISQNDFMADDGGNDWGNDDQDGWGEDGGDGWGEDGDGWGVDDDGDSQMAGNQIMDDIMLKKNKSKASKGSTAIVVYS